MGLTIFTFLVMGVIVGSAVVVFVVFGRLPGQIARQRNHPNADAVTAAGWIGVITMGILWPLAFVWAYTNPGRVQLAGASRDEPVPDSGPLAERLRALTSRVEALESATPAKR